MGTCLKIVDGVSGVWMKREPVMYPVPLRIGYGWPMGVMEKAAGRKTPPHLY